MGKEEIKVDLYFVVYALLDKVAGHILMGEDVEENDLEIDSIDDLVDLEFDDNDEVDVEDDMDIVDFEDESADEYFDEYNEQDKDFDRIEAEQVDKFYAFLTSDSKYDEICKIVLEQMDYPFIQNNIVLYKHIIMLIVASTTYCGMIYDEKQGIIPIDDDLWDIYNNMISDSQSVYRIFKDEKYMDIAKKLIDQFLTYYSLEENYLHKILSLYFIKSTKKLPTLLKMNPFESLAYLYNMDIEELTESELAIQYCRDAYDCVLSRAYDEELNQDERKQYFLDKLSEYYNYDDEAVDRAIAYIFSNIYLNLKSLSSSSTTNLDSMKLMQFIEDNSNNVFELVGAFRANTEFFWRIIDKFYSFNYDIDIDTLFWLRNDFKTKKGNVKVLKRLNPFYEQEEEAFPTMESAK